MPPLHWLSGLSWVDCLQSTVKQCEDLAEKISKLLKLKQDLTFLSQFIQDEKIQCKSQSPPEGDRLQGHDCSAASQSGLACKDPSVHETTSINSDELSKFDFEPQLRYEQMPFSSNTLDKHTASEIQEWLAESQSQLGTLVSVLTDGNAAYMQAACSGNPLPCLEGSTMACVEKISNAAFAWHMSAQKGVDTLRRPNRRVNSELQGTTNPPTTDMAKDVATDIKLSFSQPMVSYSDQISGAGRWSQSQMISARA